MVYTDLPLQALNPFRRQLFNELYATNELVRAFAGGLPGGRLMLPAMDDWTLGILRRKRNLFTIFNGNYKQPNIGATPSCDGRQQAISGHATVSLDRSAILS